MRLGLVGDIWAIRFCLVTAFSPFGRRGSTTLLRHCHRGRNRSICTRRYDADLAAMSSDSMSELEVEQKFAIYPGVEDKLISLGFVRKGDSIQFTDIYYDLPAPNWSLTPRDIWLRYRGQRVRKDGDGHATRGWKGNWQLKIGRQSDGDGAVTVYEEIQGERALTTALSMIEASSNSEPDVVHTDQLPPNAPANLSPFAEFETSRSSWILSPEAVKKSPDFVGLSVDIDTTDFDYGVGEVEAILHSRDDNDVLSDAERRIGRLVSKLVGESSSTVPSLGKLETFMMKHRRDHFDACMKASIFK